MAKTYFVRTEARTTAADLEAGIAARLHDPAWMLGRQWQLGELLGEDAGSPVSMTLDAEVAMVTQYRSARGRFQAFSPQQTPLEPLIEADSHRSNAVWTARLRIDTGRAFLHALQDAKLEAYSPVFREAFRIDPPSAALRHEDPAGARLLEVATGRIPDGQRLFARLATPLRDGVALPPIAGVAPMDADGVRAAAAAWLNWCDETIVEGQRSAWRDNTLDYEFSVATGTGIGATVLDAIGHTGGSLDWHAFDAQPVAQPAGFTVLPQVSGVPTGVYFRGMPNARWWEFEDETIDLGSVDAGASDVARMAFLEFALVYGNDFFAVPLRLPVGSLSRVTSLVVADTFGMRLSIASANRRQGKQGAARFGLFALTERDPQATGTDNVSDVLFLAPVVGQLLAGASVEEVLLLRDEMANLCWAVERRYEGERGLPIDRHEVAMRSVPPKDVPSRDSALRYVLGSEVPPYWFPLVPTLAAGDMSLELQRMANQPSAVAPRGRLVTLGGSRIGDEEVPREGTRLLRDYAMTRWTNGQVFMWARRRRLVGSGEGSSGLRFDLTERS